MYHVIIVEDDPMVASINRQYLLSNSQFVLDGSFTNGVEALQYLEKHSVDLVIADYYMPLMDGIEFIRSCRVKNYDTVFIMITAASSIGEITGALSYGVLDYIVKPFSFERFQAAMQKFVRVKEMKKKSDIHLSQEEVDSLVRRQMGQSADNADLSVKGIAQQTLEMIREYLRERPEEYLTSDEISKDVHISRITVRRYLNFMLENHEITSMMDYSTGGRPSLRYRII